MKQTYQIAFGILLLIMSSCSILKNSVNNALVFELQTTSCYGTCPVYTLQVFSDASVLLHGKEHMEYIGSFKSQINKEKLSEIIESFDNASFFEFENSYRSQFKDLPTKYITYYKNGDSKKVMAYDNIPKDLRSLIKKLEVLVDELNWEKIN